MADDMRMIKGSEIRKADHEIEPLLLDRWSPRVMSGEEISHEELIRLFEAARWAPSSFNAQPWRALYARRGTEHWQTFFDLLVDANKVWAKNAAVLVLFISRKGFEHDNELSITHFVRLRRSVEKFRIARLSAGSRRAWDVTEKKGKVLVSSVPPQIRLTRRGNQCSL